MPSREPELYKDKIEVSLDGRQIFYLFFGGAVIVGLVFVLGVMVGRRVEARGHLDRAQTQTASDPLAALDRLERSDDLSFHGALTGSGTPTDVEKAIGELEKRRATGKAEPKAAPPANPPAMGDAKPARADKQDARADKHDADKHGGDKQDARADKHDGDKRDGDKREGDKHDGDKHAKKHDDAAHADKADKADKPVTRPDAKAERAESHADAKADRAESHADAKADRAEGHADAKAEDRVEAKPDARKPSADGKGRFTLQLSSFQDRSEAEAFLTAMKSAGYQPYLTEADVGGKGTFYRVRLGSYRSVEAATDAKADYEKAAKKTAQVMRL
jgi:DedD protein